MSLSKKSIKWIAEHSPDEICIFCRNTKKRKCYRNNLPYPPFDTDDPFEIRLKWLEDQGCVVDRSREYIFIEKCNRFKV